MGDVLYLGGCLSVTVLASPGHSAQDQYTNTHTHPQQSDHVPAGVFYAHPPAAQALLHGSRCSPPAPRCHPWRPLTWSAPGAAP